MKKVLWSVVFLLSAGSFAFENTQQKNEILQFFWNENNSVLDIQTHFYLRDLAKQVAPNESKNYDFFVIKNPQVNAFATEYGLIGINTGLINLTDSESELASVLAHEIAHIKLEHFVRFRQKNKYNDLLAIGGVVLAGLSKNSEVSQALFSSSIAKSLSLQINFTREHELEADNYGLKLLKKSKFDDFAMSDFFAKLPDNPDAIEYISTHPLSKNRIINNLIDNKKTPIKNSFAYHIIKTSLDNNYFLEKNPELKQYMLALQHFENNDFQKTIEILKDAQEDESRVLKARAFAKLGKLEQVVKLLNKNSFLDKYFLAESYFLAQKYKTAKNILKELSYYQEDVYIYELLAKINLAEKDSDKYHYNIGKSLILQGKIQQAKQHFVIAKHNTQNQDLFDVLDYKIKQLND